MGQAHDTRSMTGSRRLLLVVALLAAGAAALTDQPRPAEAAATGVDCSRGENLGFEHPVVSGNDAGKDPSEVPGWDLTPSTEKIALTYDADNAPEGKQYAVLPVPPITLRQRFETLRGDVISWSILHNRKELADIRTDYIKFGAVGDESHEGRTILARGRVNEWLPKSGTAVVEHTGDTVISFTATRDEAGDDSFLDDVRLRLKCGISIAASGGTRTTR